jgi:hypothetical protein
LDADNLRPVHISLSCKFFEGDLEFGESAPSFGIAKNSERLAISSARKTERIFVKIGQLSVLPLG